MAHMGNPPDHASGPRRSLFPVLSASSSSSSLSSLPPPSLSLSSLSISSSSGGPPLSSPSSSSPSSPSSSSSSSCSFPSPHAFHPHHAQHPIDRRIRSVSSSASSPSLIADAAPCVSPLTKQVQGKRKKIDKLKRSICPPTGNGRLDEMTTGARLTKKQAKLTEKHASSKEYKDKLSPYAGACCTCTVGIAADCAAICCCPVALLQLLALSLVKLPCVVVWRMLKKHLRSPGPYVCEEDDRDVKVDTPRQSFGSPWSSPRRLDPFSQTVRFESQSLWNHFEAGCVGFGGLAAHAHEEGVLPIDRHCDLNE